MSRQYLRGAAGNQDTELDGSGNWIHTNIFSRLGLAATFWNNGGVSTLSYNFNDWLGTKRMQATSTNSSMLEAYSNSYPYGNYLTVTGNGGDATEHHYTGKERDAESGNDYFDARYYGSSMGRFMSPDPSGLVYADPTNPQSLNLYSYALNNPLRFKDPTGKAWCDWGGGQHDDDPNADNNDNPSQDANESQCRAQGGNWDPCGGIPNCTSVTADKSPSLTTAENVLSFVLLGPKNISYGSQSAFTQDFQKSLGMAHINDFIKGRCGTQTPHGSGQGFGFVGTGEAFANTLIDSVTGQDSPSQAQLGAFEYRYNIRGGEVDVTVTNDISINSLAYHALDTNPNLTSEDMLAGDTMVGAGQVEGNVPFGAVHQYLNIVEANPCLERK